MTGACRLALLATLAIPAVACRGEGSGAPPVEPACDAGNGGLTLPAGFCATIFADTVGRPRDIAVAPWGDVYVLSGGVLLLRDTDGDGHADVSARPAGYSGGAGLTLHGHRLYVDVVTEIIRFSLDPGALTLPAPDTIVRGLPTGGHGARNMAVNDAGELFVNVGSATNVCEGPQRDPCAELQTRAGIWRFDAVASNQQFSPAARFATGIRNAVAITTDGVALYVVQHGRDGFQSFPQLFDLDAAAENPAEELFRVSAGNDFGWPYCYYDLTAGARVLAPEYGGDRSTVGRCAGTTPPLVVFPGHWAPNGIVFHPGRSFPARYRGGAFIAFHGSWNRAPRPQQGYRVVFVPAGSGGPGPTYEAFADGFAGAPTIVDPADAAHRPSGLAVGPDGALYVTDDAGGRIYRIVYRGS